MSQLGSIGGPLFAGWVFDTTGDYSLAWVLSGVLLILSLPLLVFVLKQAEARKDKSSE